MQEITNDQLRITNNHPHTTFNGLLVSGLMDKNLPRLISLGLMPLIAVASGLLVFKNMFLTFALYHIVVCIGKDWKAYMPRSRAICWPTWQ
jgi:hypothetical protein